MLPPSSVVWEFCLLAVASLTFGVDGARKEPLKCECRQARPFSCCTQNLELPQIDRRQGVSIDFWINYF